MGNYTPEQIDACILAYKAGDLNYCRAGIIDLLTAYAATLRQQAGRVDEGVTLHDRVEFALRDAGFDYDEAFRIAALAQNTQESVPAAVVHSDDTPGHFAIITPSLPRGTKLYLPAERARVPDGWVMVRKASLSYWLRELNGARHGDNAQQRAELVHSGLAAYLAAAPSAPEGEAVAWRIDTDDDVERVAKAAGWDNRRYMTQADYAVWCERMREFVRLAAERPAPAEGE